MKKLALTLLGVSLLLSGTSYAHDSAAKLAARSDKAAQVLNEYTTIPMDLLRNAQCVLVIPHIVKLGFIVGVQTGEGLASCRTAQGWTNPSFTKMTGGSFGYLAGLESVDLVLIFANNDAADRLGKGDLTLGGNASVAAGPVGRDARVGTDFVLKGQIYSYSRSKGIYAGVSLDGTVIKPSNNDNATIYGDRAMAGDLLRTYDANPPAEVVSFLQALQMY